MNETREHGGSHYCRGHDMTGTPKYSYTLMDARNNGHDIKVSSRNPVWCSLETAVSDIRECGGKWMNERHAREVCTAIYGEPVSCETVYPDGKKVCVLEYGRIYEEFPSWRKAVLSFIAMHYEG